MSTARRPASSAAALYHRVSTLDQDPTLAREELRAAAQARGLRVALDVEETGSGARADRPGLARIMAAARRSEIAVLLAWKLDRIGRSALDVLAQIRALTDAGVRVVCTSQGIDVGPGGDAMSRLVLTVLAAIAEWERDVIRERTVLGLDAARRRGVRLGRRVGTCGKDRKQPRPDAHEVARLRALGQSWAAIARAMGCTASAARRAALRPAKMGASDRASRTDGTEAA